MRLDQVGKRYGLRFPWVLHQISLDIPAGRLVRFEGRNGSGKSTLLRIIAGVAEPSRGKVTGRPVTGYVPERFPPALPFPARDYLAHIGRVHDLAGRELGSRIDECLDRLGGRELAPVPMRMMSKGMSQKVAVAQALLPGRGLLVLDEAWTGLDVQAKAALDEAVAERVSAGGFVVFVDHDPARLARLEAERWLLEGAAAVPAGAGLAGPDGASAGRTSQTSSPPAQTHDATVIELTGLAAAGTAVATQDPGVLSVRRHGERVVIRAERAAADRVLRHVLTASGDVHVVRVDAERGGPGAGAELRPPAGTPVDEGGSQPRGVAD